MTEFGLTADESAGLPMDAHTAASVGYLDVLVTLDFAPSAANAAGWTPLHYAAHYDHAETARWLMRRGAEARGQPSPPHGRTPLMLSVACGNEQTTRVLLREVGKDLLDERDKRGEFSI